MKKIIPPIFAATALLAPGLGAATEAIYGVWVREGHADDKLEFFDCSGKLCAKGLQPMPDGSPAPLVLRNAAKAGPNKWKGDLFNPEDGKTYKGEITLESQDQLSLSGCLVAFLCQSETWTKVSGPTQKPKPPEPKASDAKPGESKTGDGKTGDAKPGDSKAAKGAGHEPAKDATHEPAKGAGHEPAKGTGHEGGKAAGRETAKSPANPAAEQEPATKHAKPKAPAKPKAEPAQ
jgi:uncharacterized protein (DUF2147 family)